MSFYLYKKSSFANNPFLAPLLEIPDCPKELYVWGDLPEIKSQTKILTIVGSRKISTYGKDALRSLLRGLIGKDVVVVSGLALGVDALAHRTALELGIKTVSFPGSGLNKSVLYPRSNLNLSEQIVMAGGALVSEYPPDTRSMPYMFPQRNRIKAGIANAVLVVEAEEKSGTLITSRLATEYNRDVLAVPGSIFQSSSRGPHMLIKLGATPITSGEDLCEALGFSADIYIQSSLNLNLSTTEELIINSLSEPLSKDDLINSLGLPVTEVLSNLALLEIKGLIRQSLGKFYKV